METDSIALSSSSCAPTEFQVLSSYDSRTTTISVAVEHCQLCGGSRRPFYCRDCIRAGDFQHSGVGGDRYSGNNACWGPSESNRLQSYAEKLEKLKAAQEERLQFFDRYLDKAAKHNRCTQKITDLRLRKERNALLKLAIHNNEKQVIKGVAELKRLCKANNAISKTISSIKTKMKAMSTQFKLYRKQIDPLSIELERTKDEMVSEQRCHIANLTKYIFPIETVQQKGDSDSLMKTRVSLLAEARHTAYIKGRWIKGLSEWEEMYRIVKAVLPGNGDYALYCTSFSDASVLERRDSLPQADTEVTRRNESWNITAGLCFAAQLVQNIAIFLRTHLPWNLHFREFCWAELTEKQFSAAVFKLNCNILYLCYTQNVNLEGLHPQHTICNIRTLLDHADLGRFIMSNDLELLSAIEESLLTCSEELDLSDSIERLDIVEREWEHVPVTLPEAEMPTQAGQAAMTSYFSTPPSTQPRSSQESQSTMTSLASGLVSSAMASIWRGWGKSDK